MPLSFLSPLLRSLLAFGNDDTTTVSTIKSGQQAKERQSHLGIFVTLLLIAGDLGTNTLVEAPARMPPRA